MSRLGLLDWKRRNLGNVQLSIQSKQAEPDVLQQGFITVTSKGQAIGNTPTPIDCDQLLTRRLEGDAVEVMDKEFGEEEIKQYILHGRKQSSWARWNKFNFTHMTLIPKVLKPTNMSQFRPIALCNTIAKVISKTLANGRVVGITVGT
ncbi:hypothetical protein LIER_04221 [Lithospermum erythrorhizon]|uniref:Uncharacterized protein n=1 Tax=Lithospermum erythrorhizon TaxID=34254 RepID=A0AAV3NW40_LITER